MQINLTKRQLELQGFCMAACYKKTKEKAYCWANGTAYAIEIVGGGSRKVYLFHMKEEANRAVKELIQGGYRKDLESEVFFGVKKETT